MDKAKEVWSKYDAAHDGGAYLQVVADLKAGGFGNPDAVWWTPKTGQVP